MIPSHRKQFNSHFSDETYHKVKQLINEKYGDGPGFRMSESPVFLTKDFRKKLMDASEAIVNQIKKLPQNVLEKAIPEQSYVPNDTEKPHFLAIDFGICKNEKDEIVPQLIELQAFPSLYGFQQVYKETNLEVYPFLKDLETDIPRKEYIESFKKIILNGENPENVILLELYPEQQKTHIDFVVTKDFTGIETVCLSKIKKQGRQLFYEKNGELILIKRIYNRVIFDELERLENFKSEFDFRDDVDVEWVTHPNWFFKISKYILPKLQHDYIPKSYFANEFPDDEQLENFVLKPLFSFAGSGVDLYPTQETLQRIDHPEHFILQRKVSYAPIFEDINGDFSKAEIRLLFLWNPEDENPTYVANIVRMTKAEMVNVDFNKKDAIWIGSSYAIFPDK